MHQDILEGDGASRPLTLLLEAEGAQSRLFPRVLDVPRRSNFFQRVIAVVHAHMSEGAIVEESAMLPDRESGTLREVDVVIKVSKPYETVVSIEATSTTQSQSSKRRRANVEWVERMLGKHASLPTNLLVLVSETGFTQEAMRKATARGALALTPEDLDETDLSDEALRRFSAMTTLRQTHFRPTRIRARLKVVTRAGNIEVINTSRGSATVFLDTGQALSSLDALAQARFANDWDDLVDSLNLGSLADGELQEVTLDFGVTRAVINGVSHALSVELSHFRDLGDSGPALLLSLEFQCTLQVSRTDIDMRTQKLGDIYFASGRGTIDLGEITAVRTWRKGQAWITDEIRIDPQDGSLKPHRLIAHTTRPIIPKQGPNA